MRGCRHRKGLATSKGRPHWHLWVCAVALSADFLKANGGPRLWTAASDAATPLLGRPTPWEPCGWPVFLGVGTRFKVGLKGIQKAKSGASFWTGSRFRKTQPHVAPKQNGEMRARFTPFLFCSFVGTIVFPQWSLPMDQIDYHSV